MKTMLSRQLNLVYSQINSVEIDCEAKRTNNLSRFHGKIRERQNQSPARKNLAVNHSPNGSRFHLNILWRHFYGK